MCDPLPVVYNSSKITYDHSLQTCLWLQKTGNKYFFCKKIWSAFCKSAKTHTEADLSVIAS